MTQLVAKYRAQGLEAISWNHYGGNHRNMSEEEEAAILAPFKREAEKGKVVGTKEMAEAYQRAVDHPVGKGQVYRVLHRHEWRKSIIVIDPITRLVTCERGARLQTQI